MQRGTVVVRYLDADVSPDRGDWAEERAVHWAAGAGHADVVRLLLERGARLSLAAAAMLGDLPTVSRLLAAGADVDAQGPCELGGHRPGAGDADRCRWNDPRLKCEPKRGVPTWKACRISFR